MQNQFWKSALRLGLIVLASAGLVIGAEIVGVSIRPGFAQEQQEQRFTGRLSEDSETVADGSYYNIYTLEAQAGQSFLIEMVSDEFDTYLIVFDAQGNKLAESNDGENGTNTQLSITVPTTGQYAIVATSSQAFQPGETGAYSLSIRAIQSESVSQLPNQSAEKAEADRLFQQGFQQYQTGQFQEALALWEATLQLYREIDDQQGVANSLSGLGVVSDFLGQYQTAIDYHEQSLEIAQAIDDRHGEGAALNNLGNAYFRLGNYQRAIDYNEQALIVARQLDDRQVEGAALGNLGSVYLELGDYQRAIDYSEQSLTAARQISNLQGEANSLGSIGTAYQGLGDYQSAIDYHEQSLRIARKIGDRQVEANSLNSLGTAYLNLGDYQSAIDYHKQSLAITREIGDRQVEANSLNNLGVIYLDTQQYSDAESVLYSAIEVLEALRDSELSDEDKVSLFETQMGSYMGLQQVLVAQNKTNPALEIAERSRARALVEFLSDRVSERTAEDITINLPSLSEIQRIAQQQNATLVSYSIINFRNQDPLLYIWVIQPTGDISFQSVDLTPLNTPLSDLITLSRSNLGVRSRNDGNIVSVLPPEEQQRQQEQQRQSLSDLYNILIAPIAESLPTEESDRIIFIPQGELFLVPFAALVDNNDQYLIENHTLSIAPSIQTLALTRQLQNPNGSLTDNPLIVGNPTMPRLWNPSNNLEERLPSLPGAENEAMAIAQQLNTEALLWDNASETRVAQQMQNASLIHLATHGLLDYGTPEETGTRDVPGAIALAPDSANDGLLTSAEILAMELQANLVVLSACDTGRGTITGDGVIGLSRSLMQAGVPSVVVSLWSVPDDSTEFLMKQFYANLDEMDKAQALRQAMLTTMQQSDYSPPLDWAAFTLIGEAE